ncbi:hypothetical protein HHL17_07020 [Chitinophaga sp. G-6-1-13]|uniref:Peptidase metallopeptidase domain-containing protein n=1 Tax=Chitinophaga fulva TaxID=2728842 RepID=A0A848GFR2_9BACT|nr:M57 family metalloprotease [Chitinophaga fulva]NML36946.1 hypothetical protein [Chitinophaga fulva]
MNKSFYFRVLIFSIALLSCKKQDKNNHQQVPTDIITQLQAAGFDTSEGVSIFQNGYLVEYDIFLTADQIKKMAAENDPKKPRVEHYRTNNIVTGSNRVIHVFMDPNFDNYMQQAFDEALARYNNLHLGLSFDRVNTAGSADIRVESFYQTSGVLGISAGFPSGGNPASPIKLNTYHFNSNSHRADATTTIAHEIGHAIGFRHTDYMNRTFSCGIGGDEGDGGVGANNIPGTPQEPSAGSWMLACSDGSNRPFIPYDKLALNALFPYTGDKRVVYSYYANGGGDHYLSTAVDVTISYWKLDDVAFRAYQSPINGAVPIYQHYNAGNKDHYYSSSASTDTWYWNIEGVAFYAYKTQVPGTIPVYQYFSPSGVEHYYSTAPNGANSYWNYDGVAFYAFPENF